MANFRYSDPLLQTRLESQSSQPRVSQLEPPNAGSGLALTPPPRLDATVASSESGTRQATTKGPLTPIWHQVPPGTLPLEWYHSANAHDFRESSLVEIPIYPPMTLQPSDINGRVGHLAALELLRSCTAIKSSCSDNPGHLECQRTTDAKSRCP